MSARRILVVGSANVDLVTNVARCPRPGETLIGTAFKTIPGGKGANQAVAAARLGARTWFAGCVGQDVFGAMQRDTLSADGIDLTYLKTHPSEPTGTAVILVTESGQNSIVVIPAADRKSTRLNSSH
jgi:ribokinase